MEITNHRFVGVPFVQAADQGGVLVDPLFIVIHYTGGAGRGAIGTLTAKDDNYVSSHTFTDTDGAATQMVRFDRQAYHAGESSWRGIKRLNHRAFGLELANPGYVRPGSPAPHNWPTIRAAHKHGGVFREWYVYPPAQVESAAQQCAAIMRFYTGVREIVGHDDIAPTRKLDPGPAWDWVAFRARVAELLRNPTMP